MRGAIVFSLPCTAMLLAIAPAQAQQTTYHVCVVRAFDDKGRSHTVAITEPFAYNGKGMMALESHFDAFVSDVERGKVAVNFQTAKYMEGECFPGGTDRAGQVNHMQNRLRYEPSAVVIQTPLDNLGQYRRSSQRVAKAPTSPPTSATTKPVEPSKPTLPEWELKYQRELAAYQRRIKEIEVLTAERNASIARDEADHARRKAEAEQALQKHRQEAADAEAARRRYQAELAAHQALVDRMQTQEDRNRLVEWKEAVVVCTLRQDDGQSQFGNWRCDGPLQFTYAKLGKAGDAATGGALTALSEACGGKRESVRDLGTVNGFRLFGCSFGLHPKSTTGFHLDAAKKHGIDYVPGRATYRCPAWKSFCRTS